MQYGYFADEAKEYVITRPDTPLSWSNYLGSTEYGAIITNNAGGYGFYKSGRKGRFLRLRFNSIPMDQPGRYFYLRDNESADYWSASWQPVGKPLDQYHSTCRHGTAYGVIESNYGGIKSETTYFVPLGQHFEYWRMKVTNESEKPRALSLFTYCEFTNQWDTQQDQVNLQYSLFIIRCDLLDGKMLRLAIQDNLTPETDGAFENDNTQVWSVISGAATPEQSHRCMETVHERLATPYGLMLAVPPFVKMPIDVMRAVVFNPGVKENSGIFNHTEGWGVMAECLLGHGDQAYDFQSALELALK